MHVLIEEIGDKILISRKKEKINMKANREGYRERCIKLHFMNQGIPVVNYECCSFPYS